MSYAAQVIADSISPAGVRFTTIEATYPLIIHAQLMKHRMLSASSSSNRAISLKRLAREVETDPYVPERWFAEKKGMSPGDELDPERSEQATKHWIQAADEARLTVLYRLAADGVHRQWANRILGPFQWITTVFSGTEWENVWYQRCHPDAQDEARKIATMMRDAMEASTPRPLVLGNWHLPYIDVADCEFAYQFDLRKISAARAARTSYLTKGDKKPLLEDLDLYGRLTGDHPHPVPLEHVATPIEDPDVFCSNVKGWCQMRHQEIGGKHMVQVLA